MAWAAAAAVVLARLTLAQVTFTELPPLPGDYESYATAVSRDGQVVVGWSYGFGFEHAVRWTAAHGVEDLGHMPNADYEERQFRARGVSDDGATIVGIVGNSLGFQNHSFRWTLAGGMRDLGRLDPNNDFLTQALAVTADGLTVFGWDHNQGIRWDPFNLLQAIIGFASVGAVTPTADVLTGSGGGPDFLGLRQTRTGLEVIGDFRPFGMSDDGNTIAGQVVSHSPNVAVRWTATNRSLTVLPVPPAWRQPFAVAISGDGTAIGGQFLLGSEYRGCIWFGDRQPIDFMQFLQSQGIDLGTTRIPDVDGFSYDATVAIGTGYDPAGNSRGWLVRLGRSCPSADFDHDSDVGTDADIEAFFRCLSGNCCATCYTTDYSQDGIEATDADIEAFFRVLAGGNC